MNKIDNIIIWDDKQMVSIRYSSQEAPFCGYESFKYDVVTTENTKEAGLYYVFVRREDGKYGILLTSHDEVLDIVASDYDDIYYNGGIAHGYVSVEKEFQNDQEFLPAYALTIDSYLDPLCLVKKGVEGLLTCTPFYYDGESGKNGWRICPPFVCEAFSRDYIFINSCVIRHEMYNGEMGKAWYRENHTQVSYDEGGFNAWACYMFKKNFNSNSGRWKVIDEYNPKNCIDDIVADDILWADFWNWGHIVIAIVDDGKKELWFWDNEPNIEFRESIVYSSIQIYYTRKHTLYFITSPYGGVQIYSGQTGLISERTYRFIKYPKGERLQNESVALQYYTKEKSIAQEELFIDEEGNVVVR